jgi:nucleoside-diphosphate-sugar epimerase
MEKEVVVITECSSWIGQAILKKFIAQDVHVVGLDRRAPHNSSLQFTFIETDFSSQASIEEAMKKVVALFGSQIASIIHLASYCNVQDGVWEMYEKINLHGSETLLSLANMYDTEQFLFLSTMFVHAPCLLNEEISEDWPLCMSWEFPKSKVFAEEVLRRYHGKTPLVLLRAADCYDEECHSILLASQIQRLYEHQLESYFFPGDVNHKSSFIHIEDLAEAVLRCVLKRKSLGNEACFLVGEKEIPSYAMLQKELSKLLLGKEISSWRISKRIAKIGIWLQNHLPFMSKTALKPWMIELCDSNYIINSKISAEVLDWHPQHKVLDTLPLLVKSLTHDPEKWYRENNLPVSCAKFCCCCTK